VVKTERHPFSGETNHHPLAYYAYKASATEHVSSHHFSLLPSHHLLLLYCIVLALSSMVTDSIINPLPINPSLNDDAGDESIAESTVMTNSWFRPDGKGGNP
jgi:hypothetical protein